MNPDLPAPRLPAPDAKGAGRTAGDGGADRVVALADGPPVSPNEPVPSTRPFTRSWPLGTASDRWPDSTAWLNTIMRFSRATTPEELFTGQWQNRATRLDAFKRYLDQRWRDGCAYPWKLWEEISEQGHPGNDSSVRDFVRRTL